MISVFLALILTQASADTCRNLVTLTGVEFSSGGHSEGPEETFRFFSAAGFEEKLRRIDWRVKTLPAVHEDEHPDDEGYQTVRVHRLRRGLKILRNRASDPTDSNFILNIGGDHSMSLGPILGFAKRLRSQSKRPLVIWFDQHSDKFSVKHQRQFLHGTVIDQLVGSGDSRLAAELGIDTPMKLSDFLFIGTMSGDEDSLRDGGAVVLATDQIQHLGIEWAKDEIEKRIKTADEVWLSYDFDVIAMQYLNAVNHPGPLGLTPFESQALLRTIGSSPKIVGADFVEFVPAKDKTGKQTRTALSQIYAFMNARARASDIQGSQYSFPHKRHP